MTPFPDERAVLLAPVDVSGLADAAASVVDDTVCFVLTPEQYDVLGDYFSAYPPCWVEWLTFPRLFGRRVVVRDPEARAA